MTSLILLLILCLFLHLRLYILFILIYCKDCPGVKGVQRMQSFLLGFMLPLTDNQRELDV